ncbi:GDSL esterase/lipase At5g45960-like [Amaranthus tricolor]|uniref:GDSL esterase/lipase At5g45960-like n=1 Tax=Amaranthus tricolor TaxID=29722 RepID=UPI0025825AD0|nr:GDSL esterase/lipase At5g45960-like [Amaranthus tricolor]
MHIYSMDLIMYAAIMMTPILSISLLNNVLALRRIYYYCHSIFFLFTIILHGHAHAHDFKTPKNTSITSIFIFGDSTVDPGNNDYVKTLFRSNFLPYGIDFPNHTPTGRFTNGRLPTDFIASYAGVKEYVPAYLDPNLRLKDLMTGVSFASAGTGYDPTTALKNKVIDLTTQVQYFDEYKKKVEHLIGKKEMEKIVSNAAFIISCGTNDIVYTYGLVPYLSLVSDSISPYLRFMIKQSKWLIQELIDRGAKRIGVVGLPPVGCLPAIITLHTSPHQPRICIESLSSIALQFNEMLERELNNMQQQSTLTIIYGDIYTPLQDQFIHPHKYGFEVADRGCCGSGLFEGAITCNSLFPICNDRSKYLFWDSIHPTERSYYFLFEALRPVIDFVINTP